MTHGTREKLHIGIFGRVNSGKSSLINALGNQEIAIVSSVRGTTTDPVYKLMEIKGVGAVKLIDTAGMDDISELGTLRNAATDKIMREIDIAIIVCGGIADNESGDYEQKLIKQFKSKAIPYIVVINADSNGKIAVNPDFRTLSDNFITVNAITRQGIDQLYNRIAVAVSHGKDSVLQGLVKPGDIIVLVMPQDGSAPEGRLILPQVRVLREILDIKAIGIECIPENLAQVLDSLRQPPSLIITDSQVFNEVYSVVGDKARITSFSILLAGYKGDINAFVCGAAAMDSLNANSKVLIAEACSHVPQNEDIGRVKIPKLLMAKYGVSNIAYACGNDFPTVLTKFDLIIHCGACMFNRALVMSRVNAAIEQGVPITNYGIALAKINGILNKVVLPKQTR